MKFLCDNCKAKYQIADEKVAGKTVRMKCRKCGHQIEVRSAVTEGTGSIPPPAPLPGVRPPPGKPLGGGLATSLSAQKPKAPAASQVPNSALAGAFAKNVQDAPASNVGSSQPGGKIELSVTDEWYVAINGVPVGPVRISELRRKAGTGAVNEDSLCWQEGLEEWRPVKTIPELAQIVREAAAGNRPSLADASPPNPPNRISGYPSAPRTPAAPAVRPSTIPPAPLAPSAPMPVSAPVATSPMGPMGSAGGMGGPPRPTAPQGSMSAPPVGLGGTSAPIARSNVVPLRPNAPLAPSMDDVGMGGPFGSAGATALAPQTSPLPVSSPIMPVAPPAPDPFAPSGPMPAAAAAFSLTPTPGSMAPQPAANPLMSSSPSFGDAGSLSRPSYHPPNPSFSAVPSNPIAPVPVPVAAPEKKGGTPLWFWPILVLFLGFGGGAAYFVFARVQQPQPPVVIQMPAPAAAPAAAPTDSAATIEVPSAEPVAANDEKPGTPKKAGAPKKPAGGGAPAAEPKQGLDLGGLGGPAGGPNVGPGPGGGAGGGGGLDQNGVERVVSAHRAGVKRTCWERGGADQKSSVNVTVTATVAPNGTVQSASSSGDDPVVGKCIENQVKSWTFPAPGSQTQINIPFKFVRQ